MFGHLNPEDVVNLMEGGEPPAKHKAHLDSCADCRATWECARALHAEMNLEMRSMDAEIPEPDWHEFRSSVRDQLLSRSIKRESVVRRWTGWAIRPAAGWAMSALLVVGLTTVTLLWKSAESPAPLPAPSAIETPVFEPAVEAIEVGPETGLFDDILQLGEEQQEQLRQLLESAPRGAQNPQ